MARRRDANASTKTICGVQTETPLATKSNVTDKKRWPLTKRPPRYNKR